MKNRVIGPGVTIWRFSGSDTPLAEARSSRLTLADKPVQSVFFNGEEESMDALEMLPMVFGGEMGKQLLARCSVKVDSYLVCDSTMVESPLALGRHGQFNLIRRFVVTGITRPAAPAGALARARSQCESMLAAYREPALESSRRGELDRFVERRSAELL